MKNLKIKNVLIFVSSVLLFVGGWYTHSSIFPSSYTNDEFAKLTKLHEVLNDKWYYAGTDVELSDRLIEQAMVGMSTNDFDPHTVYFTKEELESFELGVDQTYVGIGIEMQAFSPYPVISDVFEDSPAQKAGLEVGDYLVAGDGVDFTDMSFDEIREIILGEEGSDVVITYQRNGVKKDVTVTRASISNTVIDSVVDDNIGVIRITTFGSYTPNELVAVLDNFEKEGITEIIIDLRNNGGGYLDAVVKMTDLFLEKDDVIFKQVYGNGEEVEYKATDFKYDSFMDVIILVNENTASASEVFASALQDHGVATVVGDQTYGKGTSQTTYAFADGSALKYTQTQWFRSSGGGIDGVGVIPDYQVSLPEFITTPGVNVEEDFKVEHDEVNVEIVSYIQKGLNFLGYPVDREDGYFSDSTLKALNGYQADYNLEVTSYIDNEVYSQFYSDCARYYVENIEELDSQLNKGIALLS